MNNTTDVDNLELSKVFIEEDDSNLLECDDSGLGKIIMDLSVSLSTRIKALNRYSDGFDIIDMINRIGTLYMFSEAKLIEKYLYEIVVKSKLEPSIKLIASRNLKSYSDKAYECYDYLAVLKDFPLISRLDCMCVLLENENFRERGLKYLDDFFNDKNIDCYYRYKHIIGLKRILEDDIKGLIINFIDGDNPVTYKILGCQYILTTYPTDSDNREKCENKLLSFLDDHSLDYNVRADSCDVVLRYGSEENVKKASLVLENLALDGKLEIRTIYDNAQNVHNKAVEESVEDILKELVHRVDTKMTNEQVYEEITEYLEKSNDDINKDNVNYSLKRIEVDNAKYGKTEMRLISVLNKVWCYIKTHEYSDELKKRLLEELNDTVGLCSSGYVSRIVNSLSGLTDLSIRISYEDQIIANMGAKLNTKIMDIEDELVRDQIINEMTIPSHCYFERTSFLEFFRSNISSIRTELYEEFKGLMEDIDFDLYTKKAIMKYQGDYMN
jgi:hypothetical protein